jgi:hypothetical protein
VLSGKWTYRSFHNNEALIAGDAEQALKLIFGEGVFDLVADTYVKFHGGFHMGEGYDMTLDAALIPDEAGQPPRISIVGLGVEGTATAGWRYDYDGAFCKRWDKGIDQVEAFVGTVIRINPHGAAKAGKVASFVAVRNEGM